MGAGESSADIANQIEIAGAQSVAVWTRRFQLIAPRFMQVAFDQSEEYDEYQLLRNQETNPNKVSGILELRTTSRLAGWVPLFFYALL